LTAETVSTIWQAVLADFSGLLEENASRCESVAFCVPNRLVVTFQAKYTSCKAFCERPDQLSKLEAALAEATQTNVKIDFVLWEDDKPAAPAAQRPVPHRQRLAEKAEHPLVRRAIELFDAQLLRIEEPGN
jgi:DNA polymerase III subunit gamma/tau